MILAGISINGILGDNGIVNQAQNAKVQTEISEEKEIVKTSAIRAIEKDRKGNITKENLESALKENSKNETEVYEEDEDYIVHFKEKDRYYKVDGDGNVTEFIIYVDKTPGSLDGSGTEEDPFRIETIEDLVVFSIMTNGGNEELGIESNNFNGLYVSLERTLNFESVFSYDDYTTTIYGDLNEDGIIEEIKSELTRKDEGCVGFIGVLNFCGIFDGKENMIKNLYQNVSDEYGSAFFEYKNFYQNGEIKNLSLSGTVINTKWHAAGISCGGYTKIDNCKNYANVTGYNMVGGIHDYLQRGTITNCINYGTIEVIGMSWQYGGVGGIAGHAGQSGVIDNCINEGKIVGTKQAAGIVGCTGIVTIKNCINKGESLAGIAGWVRGEDLDIINCCNLGKCTDGIVNAFAGCAYDEIMELDIINCYNLGEVSNCGIIGSQSSVVLEQKLNIENCYTAGNSDIAIIKSIIDKNANGNEATITRTITNTYYDTTKSTSIGAMTEGITGLTEGEMRNNEAFIETLNNNIADNSECRKWIIGEDGWPTFE